MHVVHRCGAQVRCTGAQVRCTGARAAYKSDRPWLWYLARVSASVRSLARLAPEGPVYRARDTNFGRAVAIRILEKTSMPIAVATDCATAL